METVQWKVDGMHCSNCALTIRRYLEKEGLENVKVNYANGDVLFDVNGEKTKDEIAKGIKSLGYTVTTPQQEVKTKKPFLSSHLERFLFCLPFTVLLMLHMIHGVEIMWLMDPWIQFALALPVYIVGMSFFGRSALKSITNGLPNMNVLIAL